MCKRFSIGCRTSKICMEKRRFLLLNAYICMEKMRTSVCHCAKHIFGTLYYNQIKVYLCKKKSLKNLALLTCSKQSFGNHPRFSIVKFVEYFFLCRFILFSSFFIYHSFIFFSNSYIYYEMKDEKDSNRGIGILLVLVIV